MRPKPKRKPATPTNEEALAAIAELARRRALNRDKMRRYRAKLKARGK